MRHSEDYLGSWRSHLWRPDFLALMGTRWGLADVREVLDVGCGNGHWGFALGTVLPSTARVVGVDRDPGWVVDAKEAAEGHGLGARYRYEVSTAEVLPFEDASFDMVTCQTLLMHVADPEGVLREMLRVLRPGGLLVAVEPNNLVQSMIRSTVSDAESPEETAAMALFHLRCERGKRALGEGDNSIGDRLPGLFVALGLEQLNVSTNDQVFCLTPPYDTPAQSAFVAMRFDHVARRIWAWPRDKASRYFEAGGGAPADFDAGWEAVHTRSVRDKEAIEAGTFSTGGGVLGYLVSGRKAALG